MSGVKMQNYNTKILKPTKKNLALAAQELKNGNLVGMPTETVYGLAADAFNEEAVNKIFIAKNRPQDNPLIVHVHENYNINALVSDITPIAKKLLRTFTPGPITLVFKSKGTVCESVSRGLNTIAIRIPEHKVAQKLLKECNLPIAAPSANISSRMSATSAKAVYEELNGKLPIIIDGKKSKIGIESTVVDVTGEHPIILRPGKITQSMIERVVNQVMQKTVYEKDQKVLSPGVKYKHYLPSVPVYVAKQGEYSDAVRVYNKLKVQNLRPVIVCLKYEKKFFKQQQTAVIGANAIGLAKNLYSFLRKLEKEYSHIIIMSVKNEGFGLSVMNRINKMHSFLDEE